MARDDCHAQFSADVRRDDFDWFWECGRSGPRSVPGAYRLYEIVGAAIENQ